MGNSISGIFWFRTGTRNITSSSSENVCQLCKKEGTPTGCRCKSLCMNCLYKIAKMAQIAPRELIFIDRRRVFTYCTTCLTRFNSHFINEVSNDKNIRKLRKAIKSVREMY